MYRHSQGRQISSLREAKPEPIIKINKDVAENLGIKDGDWVSISTRRGSIRQKANLVDWIHPNVVAVDYAWWFPEKGPGKQYGWEESNINVLLDNETFCREMGSPSMRGIFCNISKEE
jgi:anaerobic selenocysteine-containing dehydrogenase